jgi:hypothetical protein
MISMLGRITRFENICRINRVTIIPTHTTPTTAEFGKPRFVQANEKRLRKTVMGKSYDFGAGGISRDYIKPSAKQPQSHNGPVTERITSFDNLNSAQYNPVPK